VSEDNNYKYMSDRLEANRCWKQEFKRLSYVVLGPTRRRLYG